MCTSLTWAEANYTKCISKPIQNIHYRSIGLDIKLMDGPIEVFIRDRAGPSWPLLPRPMFPDTIIRSLELIRKNKTYRNYID